MGVRGLSGYLSKFPDNFTPYQLHNALVVFDAENFINNFYRNSSLSFHYGGEYMDFTVCIRIFLKQLKKCRITPIFVFDGCHGKEGTKLTTLLKRNEEKIEQLRSFISNLGYQDADHLANPPEILPKLTNTVFVEILRQSGITYVACNREADVHIAELAIYLNCPLISNDSDFFIFRPSSMWNRSRNYRVIPLSSLDSQCHRVSPKCSDCQDSSSGCFALSCSLFNAQGPSLAGLHSLLLPLLAVLVGNDFVDSLRMPRCIEADIHKMYQSGVKLSYTAKRISAVLRWLISFGRSSGGDENDIIDMPLNEILSLYNGSELTTTANQILLAMCDYKLYPSEIWHQMSTFISVPSEQICPLGHPAIIPDTPTIGVNTINGDVNNVSICVDLITKVVKQNSSTRGNDAVVQDLSYRWPRLLLRSFRKCRLSTSLLDSLYVHNGAVMRLLLEDISQISESIYTITNRLRFPQYGLLIGLEKHLGCLAKLCGLEQFRVVEHRRHGIHMVKFYIPISPINLYPSTMGNDRSLFINFFKQHLHVLLPVNCGLSMSSVDSAELNGLAVVFAYWFKHSQTARIDSNMLRPNSSPVGLAFIATALVTACHLSEVMGDKRDPSDSTIMERVSAELCEVYAHCANLAKQGCPQRGLHVMVVHQINELQVVFQELRNITVLLDNLISYYCPPPPDSDSGQALASSGVLSFWPLWIMFPSGRLLYWLAERLETHSAADRLDALLTSWLPALVDQRLDVSSLETIRNRIDRMLEMVNRLLDM